MNSYVTDTVAAISTPVGFSGIGIVRMTGSQAFHIINKVFKPKGKSFEEYDDKKIIYGHIIDPKDERIVDEVLVSKMIGPNTYTREDIVEINCHGGIVPVRNILNLLVENGANIAGPGEFTKRAFMNGRIDLTQAEAIIDIINAKTNKSLDISMKQLEGSLSKKISEIRQLLIKMLAHLEATIDYPEYDIEDMSYDEILQNTREAHDMVQNLLYHSQNGRLIREGVNTAIIGKPNVGKSSLLNSLLGEKRAIVTEIPGTTRDTIEEYITIEGIPFKIIDTAGVRETENIIEKIGIEKSVEILERSDLILLILDGSQPLDEEDFELLKLIQARNSLLILNKLDKETTIKPEDLLKYEKEIVQISAVEEIGLEELKKKMLDKVSAEGFELESFEIVTNIRHIHLLEESLKSLKSAIGTIEASMPLEIVSTDITEALNLLGEITGDTIHEQLMHEIFSNFCIGK
ncbi:tRNA modification GTPase trmE [Alkalibaculum bacchi]|uniref:tRNA modification GTPase MnmE n=1 Tax=Alkalibaculum bacchi TaxID=645887 RepID=A0A366I326_9FIRM|nr:tRNA uridine-5-carboxymethylaminomethyl(34) synthesis GTPase MnmE [Alkalibaculum bacchi]RBP62103.1 tRNA modification GTPase trmE [Alkalibaculum bacchi]